jgi:hypothetical protein
MYSQRKNIFLIAHSVFSGLSILDCPFVFSGLPILDCSFGFLWIVYSLLPSWFSQGWAAAADFSDPLYSGMGDRSPETLTPLGTCHRTKANNNIAKAR